MTGNYEIDCGALSNILNLSLNFDIVRRDFLVAGRRSSLFFVDGFMKDEIFERLLAFLYRTRPEEIDCCADIREFSYLRLPYVEVAFQSEADELVTQLLSGQAVIIIDGFSDAMLVDTRT